MRRRSFLIPILLLLLLLRLRPDPAMGGEGDDGIVSGIEIVLSGESLPARGEDLVSIARKLIFLEEGEPFSTQRLEESIDALKLCKRFRAIDVASEDRPDGLRLRFTLTPADQIEEIRLSGVFPLFEHEVLDAMTIFVGDLFIPEEMPRQARLVEERYEREGFIAPKVSISWEKDPENGFYILDVAIHKGRFYRISDFAIEGNRAFSDRRLRWKTKSWRATLFPGASGRFIAADFEKDVKKLTAFYWKHDYPDARIEPEVVEDREAGRVSITLHVTEGDHYEAHFEGNEAFWDWTLRKDLAYRRKGNKNGLGVKRTVRNIEKRYHEAGYLSAKVSVTESPLPAGGRSLRFVIEEGPRSIVHQVSVEKNEALPDEEILAQMLTRPPGWFYDGAFVPEVLEADEGAIVGRYLQEGFRETEVTSSTEVAERSPQEERIDVTVEVEEGVQTLVASVTFSGLTVISEGEAKAAILLQPGTPYRAYLLKSDENSLAALVSERGYPHVVVEGSVELSEDRRSAHVTYRIDEGPFVRMGEIYYTGNFRTRRKILEQELDLEAGEPFSLFRMIEGERNIRGLSIFNAVHFKAIGLKEKRDEVNLFIEMEEKKPYFFEAGGGYESERGFYALSKVGDHNLLGRNLDAWVGGDVSQIGWQGEASLTEPRLLGSRVAANLGLFARKSEEPNQPEYLVLGSSLGFTRKWFRRLTTGLGFRYERRQQFSAQGGDEAGTTVSRTEEGAFAWRGVLETDGDDAFAPRHLLVTTPSIAYDGRDSFIRPRKGLFTSFSMDISKGLTNPLDDFLKYLLQVRTYATPWWHRLTFAFVARGGYVAPYGENTRISNDQRFFLGGTQDVRGFGRNAIFLATEDGVEVGGRVSLSGSVETRLDIGWNFEVTGFYDVGSVTESFDAVGRETFRDAVGMGLRYITPIGPIGFLYGIKLDRRPEEGFGRLHFALGYTF